MMQVRIALDNARGNLKPEMLADAEIPLGPQQTRADRFLPMPCSKLADRTSSLSAPRRIVSLFGPFESGKPRTASTPVLEGIQAGDQVVVRGSFILKSQLLKSTLESE